jgi:hypothetical protein
LLLLLPRRGLELRDAPEQPLLHIWSWSVSSGHGPQGRKRIMQACRAPCCARSSPRPLRGLRPAPSRLGSRSSAHPTGRRNPPISATPRVQGLTVFPRPYLRRRITDMSSYKMPLGHSLCDGTGRDTYVISHPLLMGHLLLCLNGMRTPDRCR